MNIIYDFDKLEGLLKSFYTISGVRYSLLDASYNVIFASGNHSAFCDRINALPDGHKRCVACDAQAASRLNAKSEATVYRCHAGAMEVVLPVVEAGQIIGYLFFGQMLTAEESVDEQWRRAKEKLAWFPERDMLKEPYYKLAKLNKDIIQACTAILKACTSYIQLEGVVRSAARSDSQRLNEYINNNYSSKVTLADASKALSMSKTKLCGIAKAKNTTFTHMLHQKRVDEAKKLLRKTTLPISRIAEMTGVSDYNYFTKLFRATTGVTPREYRKAVREGGEG